MISLEVQSVPAYTKQMDEITRHAPSGWLESLERSKAEIEDGQTVPLEPFLDELRASIERMKMPGAIEKSFRTD